MASQPSPSGPRVTCAYLNQYVGKNVTVVGKVVQLLGEQATIDADGIITAFLNREAHLSANSGVQLIGKVNEDFSIRALSAIDLGPGVDYNLANAVVEVAHRFKPIFISEK
ncbi:replication factor A protein 3 [Sordaria brevicollis]|uniref:Replication factor A protein 3 n=1 Tax=Sordaria brevicollis TaxID=83679 RepID=A0AAE0UCF1_SORBR|nr:replication factor A protein 3 [Sordaria brevicollis]